MMALAADRHCCLLAIWPWVGDFSLGHRGPRSHTTPAAESKWALLLEDALFLTPAMLLSTSAPFLVPLPSKDLPTSAWNPAPSPPQEPHTAD